MLSDIDSLYKMTICKLPNNERLKYCEDLIDKAQFNLIRNKGKMDETLESQLFAIVDAAQKEIKIINSLDLQKDE